jgi:hypothetical protein
VGKIIVVNGSGHIEQIVIHSDEPREGVYSVKSSRPTVRGASAVKSVQATHRRGELLGVFEVKKEISDPLSGP